MSDHERTTDHDHIPTTDHDHTVAQRDAASVRINDAASASDQDRAAMIPYPDPPIFDPEDDADRIRDIRVIVPPDRIGDAVRMRFTTREEQAAGMPPLVPAGDSDDPRARGGRPAALNPEKQRQICLLLSAGCNREEVARYIGCSRKTIHRTALRDPRFAQALKQAEVSRQYSQVQNVRRAAANQSWRAAAWLLERFDPARFQSHRGDSYTREQVIGVVRAVCDCLIETEVECIHRERANKHADELVRDLETPGGIERKLRRKR